MASKRLETGNKKALAVLVVLICLYAGTVVGYNLTKPELKQTPVAAEQSTPKATPKCDIDGSELLGYINAERQKLGVHTLRVHPKLSQSTKLKFDDMVANKYYGHNRLDGSTWGVYIDQVGWNGYVSEDLTINNMNAKDTWASYKSSKSHYDSLTDPRFSHVGLYTKCVNYEIAKETGPKLSGGFEGMIVSDLSVIHVAE